MKEVSHGGTSFIVGRERSPPVNEGFAGVRPTFCLCSPKKAASSQLNATIAGLLRLEGPSPELRSHSAALLRPTKPHKKKAALNERQPFSMGGRVG